MSDAGLTVLEGQGELWIDTVSFSTPAWWTLDLSPLWGFPDTRGGNLILPEVSGRRAYRRFVDETVYSLPMHITGAVNHAGTPYADPVQGLATNLDYLWDNVLTPDDGTTRGAVLEMPDGSLRGAEVQVQIVPGDLMGSYDKPAVMFLTVPVGRFSAISS